jgi:rSAM/selenodomain-associated transferase 1
LTTPIIVFAKAPTPGEVKTRLTPALGAAGAAALHERLVHRTLATAAAAALGPVELCCAPEVTHPFLVACAHAHSADLGEQGPGDLGRRMHRAFARAPGAILIGCDCPALTPAYLRAAAASLAAGDDAVLGPAEDGGYVLIALARADRSLFERVDWGGADVLETTRERLRGLRWRWRELATLWDVDRPEDLLRVERELPDGARLLAGA